MQTRFGFSLQHEQQIPEISSLVRLWIHDSTGARLLSLLNEDENKVFGITFRTPPTDSTGVAHILEHSVLCGSRKFPVKEPFVELLKGSLQTFVNAFTYPDKTCYPVASTHPRDFFNLVDVYLDAVFYPRLGAHVLQQEGWRLAPAQQENPESGPLAFQGVVLNEMKGVYSSPDSILEEELMTALFPDTGYGMDSGGDPMHIPDLTYEQFVDFHKRYYHPSNAWIYFYGDMDEDSRLQKAAEYLDGFSSLEIDSRIKTQKPFDTPVRLHKPYPATADNPESLQNKSMFSIAWVFPEPTDTRTRILCEMLEFLLVGMPASPLRKALIDSNLGEDLAGMDLETENDPMFFSTGLKGIHGKDADKVEALIFETLERIAQGAPAELVEAAVNTLEFDLREKDSGRSPRGLALMLTALNAWIYDGDPIDSLRFENHLAAIKADLAADVPLFEDLIRKWMLQNTHRASILLEPDAEYEARRNEKETQLLEQFSQGLDASARVRIAEEDAKLRALQATPDRPEDLATIPRLAVADLETSNKLIPSREGEAGGCRALLHALDSSGIAYVDLAFDLLPVWQQAPWLLPLVPLFARGLLDMGTENNDFVELNIRIAQKTGGIEPETLIAHVYEQENAALRLTLRGKSTLAHLPDLAALLREVTLTPVFDDQERFLQLALELKSGLESALVPAGHMTAMYRASAGLSMSGRCNELLKGPSQLFYVRALIELAKQDWGTIRMALETLQSLVLTRPNCLVNVTLDQESYEARSTVFDAMTDGLPDSRPYDLDALEARMRKHLPELGLPPHAEGLSVPAPVNYVARAVNAYAHGYTFNGAAMVIAKFLRTGWLWEKIRMQGGAYGAFAIFNYLSGSFVLASYRDPHCLQTLQAFERLTEYLRTLELHTDELEKSIIGAINDLDSHLLPEAKGFTALTRTLTNESDALRQTLREQILRTNIQDFREFASVIKTLIEHGRIAAVGGPKALDKAASALNLSITPLL